MPHLFCFGFGYSARALARLLKGKGWQVSGTCRNADKTREMDADGITPVIWEAGDTLDPAHLAGVSHILVSIPPDGNGDPVERAAARDILRIEGLRWLGYLSTTGVYGDRNGGRVDEDTAPAPTSERGERRLAAEHQWLGLYRRHGLPVHIFRLAGIYGPGRSQIDTVRRGEARRVIKPGQVFSRIHVDDIARILLASINRPNPGRIYNVCDDEAAPPQDVIAHAARLLNMPEPPAVAFEDADLSPMGRSFYSENKRVANDRIKTELGVTLAYPTYREGLQAIINSGG